MVKPIRQFTRAVCTLLVVCNLVGCASMPKPPSPEMREQFGRLSIVAIPGAPQGQFHTFAKGRLEGTAKGAALGSAEGLMHVLSASPLEVGIGPYGGPVITLAALVFTLVGVTVGGVYGTMQAVPADTARQIEARINTVLKEMDLSTGLAEAIYRTGASRPELRHRTQTNGPGEPRRDDGSYASLARKGIQTAVEVQVTEAGFQGGSGKEPKIRFYMNADIQVAETATGAKRYERDFHYGSEERPFGMWLAEGGKELSLGFERAQTALAERIVDELFLVTSFPFPSGLWAVPGQPGFGVCWFAPIYPKVERTSLWHSIRHNAPGIHLIYTPVDSTQPALEWESFPRPRDRIPKNESLIEQIGDVTYDLKIWEAPRDFPERLIYDRTGLLEPRHRVESPLAMKTRYFWSVRARYKMDGKPQVTRWAFSLIPATAAGMPPGGSCDLDQIPSTNFFRFITP